MLNEKIVTQGDYAYYDNLELSDNPYDAGTVEQKSWAAGWEMARAECAGKPATADWGHF
jgi:hypothetical protein